MNLHLLAQSADNETTSIHIDNDEEEELIEKDQDLVNEFVKEKLWKTVKWVIKGMNMESVGRDGIIFNKFYSYSKQRLAGHRFVNNEDERMRYAKRLWQTVMRRTLKQGKKREGRLPIPTMINNLRNGVYTTMAARFEGKFQ